MKIVVTRPKQFADRARAYALYVDGKLLTNINAGEEIEVNLPENANLISAKIDWCSSNEFNLANIKSNEKVEVKNAVVRKIWIPLYVFYAITFKRKSYLNITKIL